jgi:hypothetical protein
LYFGVSSPSSMVICTRPCPPWSSAAQPPPPPPPPQQWHLISTRWNRAPDDALAVVAVGHLVIVVQLEAVPRHLHCLVEELAQKPLLLPVLALLRQRVEGGLSAGVAAQPLLVLIVGVLHRDDGVRGARCEAAPRDEGHVGHVTNYGGRRAGWGSPSRPASGPAPTS